jgi:hypothetical protein
VFVVLAGQRVFGEFDRDQIVNEAEKGRPHLPLQTGDGATLFEMVMRDEHIDHAAGRGTALPSQGAFSAPKGGGAERLRQLLRPPDRLRRARLPPCPGEYLEVFLGNRLRQHAETTQGRHHRKGQRSAAGHQMLGIGELDAVDPRRCLSSGARHQPRQVE